MTFKIKYLRFKVWFSNLRSNNEIGTNEQIKAIKIVNRLISDHNSILSCSAGATEFKPRYIIKNDHLFIRITSDKIRIINGSYKYDVSFGEHDSNLYKVKLLFAKNIERRLDCIEQEINNNVNKSLDKIYLEITNQSDNSN